MSIDSILKSIKKNNLSYSNYLFFGEEPFFINTLESTFLQHVIPEEEKTFNQKIFYGKDTNVFTLISILKSFPMTGSRQLIILREAHKMDNIIALESYFKNPVSSSIFVICYHQKSIDKRKKWIKVFQKQGLLYESKKIYGQKISNWIQKILSHKDYKIEKSAELLLLDTLGDNLSKISNAITKLISIVPEKFITISHVQEHIGAHREYNNFELQNALAEKDLKKIFLIINYFSANPNKFPFPLTLGVLFSFFSKLLIIHSLDNHSERYVAEKIKVHPFFVSVYMRGCVHYSFQECQKAISHIKQSDLQFKGIQGASSNPLRSLLLNILYD